MKKLLVIIAVASLVLVSCKQSKEEFKKELESEQIKYTNVTKLIKEFRIDSLEFIKEITPIMLMRGAGECEVKRIPKGSGITMRKFGEYDKDFCGVLEKEIVAIQIGKELIVEGYLIEEITESKPIKTSTIKINRAPHNWSVDGLLKLKNLYEITIIEKFKASGKQKQLVVDYMFFLENKKDYKNSTLEAPGVEYIIDWDKNYFLLGDETQFRRISSAD